MVTHAQCLERAERDPQIKIHLIKAAQAWLLLGFRIEQMEVAAEYESLDALSMTARRIAWCLLHMASEVYALGLHPPKPVNAINSSLRLRKIVGFDNFVGTGRTRMSAGKLSNNRHQGTSNNGCFSASLSAA
jgi:hypothetical protein